MIPPALTSSAPQSNKSRLIFKRMSSPVKVNGAPDVFKDKHIVKCFAVLELFECVICISFQ